MALKVTPERQAYLDFTPARFSANPMAVFTRRNWPFSYREWQDLAGHLGVVARGDRYGDGFDEFLQQNLRVVEANDMAQAFATLINRRVDYFVTGYYAGRAYLAGKGLETSVTPLSPMINEGAIHHGFSKRSPCVRLRQAVSDKLQQYEADGTTEKLLDAYLARWREHSTHPFPSPQ